MDDDAKARYYEIVPHLERLLGQVVGDDDQDDDSEEFPVAVVAGAAAGVLVLGAAVGWRVSRRRTSSGCSAQDSGRPTTPLADKQEPVPVIEIA